jgi:hypothetical protein
MSLNVNFGAGAGHRRQAARHGAGPPKVEGETATEQVKPTSVIRSSHWPAKSRAMLFVQLYFFAIYSTMARS